jgi:transposase
MKKILPDTRFGDIEQLGKLIKKERDAKFANRLNGIRLLQMGYRITDVAEICGVSRIAICKWVKKWNRSGKEGLINKSGGSVSKVTTEMRTDIDKMIDVKVNTNGMVVTGKLIHGYIKKSTP